MKRRSLIVHEAQPPPALEAVFSKCGSDWTPKEKREVLAWIYEHWSRRLLVFALCHLGSTGAQGEAKDAWHDFIVRKPRETTLTKWEGVVRNYDPAKRNDSSLEGSRLFRRYLETSLKHFCLDEARKAKQERNRRQIETEHAGNEGDDPMDALLHAIQDTHAIEGFGDAGERLEEEERTRLRACIGKAMQRLARSHRLYHEIVVLFYFREMSLKEIALVLHMTEGNVKVKLFHARQVLKRYLSQEGSGYDTTQDPGDH
jgi:RNA polymerase sigma factor (sigma-70 family)